MFYQTNIECFSVVQKCVYFHELKYLRCIQRDVSRVKYNVYLLTHENIRIIALINILYCIPLILTLNITEKILATLTLTPCPRRNEAGA